MSHIYSSFFFLGETSSSFTMEFLALMIFDMFIVSDESATLINGFKYCGVTNIGSSLAMLQIVSFTNDPKSVHAGVSLERLMEGLSPKHCALSLVGEPIMYPEINTLVDELHRRRISTFLVTNAQFPEKIKMLKPVTQVCMANLILC